MRDSAGDIFLIGSDSASKPNQAGWPLHHGMTLQKKHRTTRMLRIILGGKHSNSRTVFSLMLMYDMFRCFNPVNPSAHFLYVFVSLHVRFNSLQVNALNSQFSLFSDQPLYFIFLQSPVTIIQLQNHKKKDHVFVLFISQMKSR